MKKHIIEVNNATKNQKYHRNPVRQQSAKGARLVSPERELWVYVKVFIRQLMANATILSHLIFKIHQSHNLSLDFEEERAILKSMEAAAGIAA